MRLLEADRVPDWLIRNRIRALLQQRLQEEDKGDPQSQQEHLMAMVRSLRESPIAIHTAAANEQHYEVPTEFFKYVLGPRMKYSSGLWPTRHTTFEESEEAMLALSCQRAQLENGQRVLELGCGWGSLTLWMAEKYPESRILGVSNSRTQKEYIMGEAARRGLRNVEIHTANVAELDLPREEFDRVVSVEMFEHMKNYELLLRKVASWMKPGGMLFVHIFTHRTLAYHFEVKDKSDWMTKYFFTGGIMPSADLFLHFQDHLKVQRRWWVDGRHYEKTSNHWLAGMDAARAQIMPVFEQAYGQAEAARWFQRWRMFYMAVAELFGYDEGREWGVVHYLFEKR